MKNNLNKLIHLSLVCLMVLLPLLPVSVNAEDSLKNDIVTTKCPIEGFVGVEFEKDVSGLKIQDTFSQSIRLGNYSEYTVGEIKVAVAVYKNNLQEVPLYWTILPDTYQLYPGEMIDIPVNLDTSLLKFGDYELRMFAAQGDEVSTLGTILNDVKQVASVSITKNTVPENNIEISIQVEESITDSKTTVDLITLNQSNLPLIESSMLGVISQGQIPLGTAVWSRKIDVVNLIPGGRQVTKLKDNLLSAGLYTIYGGLITDGVLQPLVSQSIKIGEGETSQSWPYISKIGLSSYPLNAQSEVVACINYVGKDISYDKFLDPVAVEFSLTNATGQVVKEKFFSINSEKDNYFSFKPKVSANNFDLVVDFFQNKFITEVIEEVDSTKAEFLSADLPKVDTIKQTFACADDLCVKNLVNNSNPVLPQSQHPLWFFAAITVAACLTMFLLLRRLDPQPHDEIDELSKHELQ